MISRWLKQKMGLPTQGLMRMTAVAASFIHLSKGNTKAHVHTSSKRTRSNARLQRTVLSKVEAHRVQI